MTSKRDYLGNVADLANERFCYARLCVDRGRIARIEPLGDGPRAGVPYVVPGFVDAHIHIESTLLTPEHFAAEAVRHGVVAVVADPHEIVNVMGEEGLRFMVRNGRRARFHFRFAVPSCVPCSPFEENGASFDARQVERWMKRDEVCALAEMMNFAGVLSGDATVGAKLAAARAAGKPVDGHAPGLRGAQARAYVEAGISTDHECTTLDEAEERIALGMKVLVREGSAARNLDDLLPLLDRHRTMLMFCSDDKDPDELREGYIDDMVRRAVRRGAPLWTVRRAAGATPVEHYRLPCGLLRVGDSADFALLDDLQHLRVQATVVGGVPVFGTPDAGGSPTVLPALSRAANPLPMANINHFHASHTQPSQLEVPAATGRNLKVIGVRDRALYTTALHLPPRLADGVVACDTERDVLKLVVRNRYRPEAAPQVAFVHGFGLQRGALAASVAHDSHNLIAVGCDDRSLARVLDALVDSRGGLSLCDGRAVHTLPLPVAGLMSDLDADRVGASLRWLKQAVRRLGCPLEAPFMTLSFLALPVIPQLKLTDKGLFDSSQFAFTTLWD